MKHSRNAAPEAASRAHTMRRVEEIFERVLEDHGAQVRAAWRTNDPAQIAEVKSFLEAKFQARVAAAVAEVRSAILTDGGN